MAPETSSSHAFEWEAKLNHVAPPLSKQEHKTGQCTIRFPMVSYGTLGTCGAIYEQAGTTHDWTAQYVERQAIARRSVERYLSYCTKLIYGPLRQRGATFLPVAVAVLYRKRNEAMQRVSKGVRCGKMNKKLDGYVVRSVR